MVHILTEMNAVSTKRMPSKVHSFGFWDDVILLVFGIPKESRNPWIPKVKHGSQSVVRRRSKVT